MSALSAGQVGAIPTTSAPGDDPPRRSESDRSLLAGIDAALAQGRAALALRRLHDADRLLRERPEFQFRAAQAYFQLGSLLGEVEVRAVPDGRPGQFIGDLLLVEPRPGRDRFLCCPRASALYQLRAALDGGLDEPAAHVLHARIWHRLGRPEIALALLQARAAVLLRGSDPEILEAYSAIALDAGALPEYLRCAWLRAARNADGRNAILIDACLTAADRYSQRGDETLYIEWLHRAARLGPEDAGLWLRLADAEWTAGRADDAARDYRRVLRVAPAHPERGRILQRLARHGAEALP